jgi:hypothetical protein
MLDAQLTVVWVRAGVATEGNGLMARLLEAGDAQFLGTKLLIGAAVGYVLFRFASYPLAQRGMRLALGLYLALMLVHAATGLSALNLLEPEAVLAVLGRLPPSLISVVP